MFRLHIGSVALIVVGLAATAEFGDHRALTGWSWVAAHHHAWLDDVDGSNGDS